MKKLLKTISFQEKSNIPFIKNIYQTLFFIAILFCTQITFGQHIEINKATITLEELFNQIEEQSSFSFLYKDSQIDINKKVKLTTLKGSKESILTEALRGSKLTYKIANKLITIIPTSTKTIKKTTIKGKVTDKHNNPLPGVTVLIKGKSEGTTSDFDGNFSLGVILGETLQFSYIGMQATAVLVTHKKLITITMLEDENLLDEIVVIGYGTSKRKNVTGAISVISSETIASKPVSGTAEAIQGAVAGLVVTRNSSRPGEEGFSLRVRDFTSVNGGNSPLIIVDGIPGDLNLINPDDIANISVLKDASAAIYGSRAAGGVILITTKSGDRDGKPKFSLRTSYAIRTPKQFFDQPTLLQYAEMQKESAENVGRTPFWTDELIALIGTDTPGGMSPAPEWAQDIGKNNRYFFFNNVNWNDLVYENGAQSNTSLSVRGGSERSKYYFSLGHLGQKGFFTKGKDKNQRINLKLNYDYTLTDRIRFNTNIGIERRKINAPSFDNNVVTYVGRIYPFIPPYTSTGEYHQWGGYANPLLALDKGGRSLQENTNVRTNFKATIELLPELEFIGQVGFNLLNGNYKENRRILYGTHFDGRPSGKLRDANRSEAYLSNNHNIYNNYTGYFQFQKTNLENHKIKIVAGASHEEKENESFWARRYDLVSNDLLHIALGDSEEQYNGAATSAWKIKSVFGRLNYEYKGKYIFEANTRYDGSSKFAEDYRWGLFKGVSGAWRISNEKLFSDNVDIINDLKLRASWGEVGNESVASNYNYMQTINIGGTYPLGNGGKIQGASYGNLPSTEGTWETLVTKNIGMDLTAFDSRLNFSLDYFKKKNKDMLVGITFPSVFGTTAPKMNKGTLDIDGWEVSLGWKDKINDNLSAFISLNLSDSKNTLTNLGGKNTYLPGLNQTREGYAINTYFGYDMIKIIDNEEELTEYKLLQGVPQDLQLGDVMFRDVDQNGKISAYGDNDAEAGDLVNLGSTSPRYNFGINLGGKYKRFDFNLFLQGVGKKTGFRTGVYSIPFRHLWWKPNAMFHNNTWSKDRPNAQFPRILDHRNSINHNWNYRPSKLVKIDGAYMRLKNIQVGYNLPENIIRQIGLTKTRLYFSGNDIWETHNVQGGYDPEQPTGSEISYPFARVFAFGLELAF